MGKVAIVGGGQAGTLAAIGLLAQRHAVTLIEGMSAEEMRHSRVRSTAVIWDESIEFERQLGLDFWREENVRGTHLRIQFRDTDSTVVNSIYGKLEQGFSGVDQRTKFPAYMEEFSRRGGNFRIGLVDTDGLEELAEENDVVLVAAGKGEINQLFPVNQQRTIFENPPRNNCAVVIKGFQEFECVSPGALKFEFYKNTGDWFALPFFAQGIGYCRAIVFQAVPGREMDIFEEASTADEVMEKVRHMVKTYAPEDWDNLKHAELIDGRAWLKGAIRPIVRHPVGKLPSGKKVLAIGDSAMTHEPICGCGANSAIRQVRTLLEITGDGGRDALNAEVLQEAVEKEYQNHAKYVFDFVKSICGDLNPPIWKMLQAAQASPSVRNIFVNMYSNFKESHLFLRDMNAVDELVNRYSNELDQVRFSSFEEAFPELSG